MKKVLKSMLVAALALSATACSKGGESGSSDAKPLTEWHDWQTLANEMETWNILHSQSSKELNVLSNLQDSLLTNDTKGALKACLAETWETNEDATVWTFHLRKGVKWVDFTGEEMGEVTAQDFITGLEYVLNNEKNGGSNSSMPREMIKGAEDYYQGTCDGTVTAADFESIVGIKALDDYTIEYTMVSPKPYFDTLATYSPLYPVSQEALDMYGESYGTNNETIWYDGPYLCSQYTNKNSKELVQNPTWWNTEDTRFEKVTIAMVEDTNKVYDMFMSGELDYVTLSEDKLSEIYGAGEGHDMYKYLVEAKKTKYSYVMHWNYDSKDETGALDTNWNTAVANENFRLAWLHGIDWTPYLKRTNKINPGKLLNDVYTMDNLVFTSDGTEYTELVKEGLGYESDVSKGDSVHARLEDTTDYKAKAMEELAAKGVTFPVTCYYTYQSGNQVAADTATVFKQMIEDELGSDFVTVEFRTYTDSFSAEIRKPDLFSISIGGWGADYGDPMNYLGQETDSDNAFYNYNYSNCTAEIDPNFGVFCDMVAEADAITDLDERYQAFADAEVFFIQHGFTVPIYYNISWQISRVNDYSKITAMYGVQSARYLNWETTSNTAYTTDEYTGFVK